jgi:hypothetical protein
MTFSWSRNFRFKPEITDWLVTEMESELDGSDPNIILNNLNIVKKMSVETYNIDMSLIKLISEPSFSVNVSTV